MHNLKQFRGSFKGYIGECMFKLTDRFVVLPRFFYGGKKAYSKMYGHFFNDEQLRFVENNWYSLDAIKISLENNKKLIIYEVKTRNFYSNPNPKWKTTFTRYTTDLYKKAIQVGFEVEVATVRLFEDWHYEIELEDFEKTDYYISKPSDYDNPRTDQKSSE